jgi:hypothetical protein
LPKFLRYSDNGYSQNAYSHNGYSHSAAYTAGFNLDAEAQWLVNMRTRWAYDYAVWRQINGPTGIFATFGGVGGYGYGNGYGLGRGYGLGHRFRAGYGYAGGYGNDCNR